MLRLAVAADLDALAQAQTRVREYLAVEGVAPKTIAAIDVVLEELGANVVRHGHPVDGAMEFGIDVRPDCVVATLADRGEAFDPTAATPAAVATSLADASTGGRGLMLLRRMTRTLSHQRVDGLNRLTAVFGRD